MKTDGRALIPRPETELLAENALKYLDGGKSALDLCTGSGAIAIVLKKKSGAEVTATDVSGDALALAAENAANNGAAIEFIKSDMFAELGDRRFDVIVSNPPYVASDEIETLQREVRDFEPRIALDGGRDGLDYYRIIAKEAKSHLKDGGILLLECGENQADAVIELLYGYKNAEKIKDLENIDRIVKAEA